jgi:hypothetical protein
MVKTFEPSCQQQPPWGSSLLDDIIGGYLLPCPVYLLVPAWLPLLWPDLV